MSNIYTNNYGSYYNPYYYGGANTTTGSNAFDALLGTYGTGTASLNPLTNGSISSLLTSTTQTIADRVINRVGDTNTSASIPVSGPGLGIVDLFSSVLANTLPYIKMGGKWGVALQSIPNVYQLLTGGVSAMRMWNEAKNTPIATNTLSDAVNSDIAYEEEMSGQFY